MSPHVVRATSGIQLRALDGRTPAATRPAGRAARRRTARAARHVPAPGPATPRRPAPASTPRTARATHRHGATGTTARPRPTRRRHDRHTGQDGEDHCAPCDEGASCALRAWASRSWLRQAARRCLIKRSAAATSATSRTAGVGQHAERARVVQRQARRPGHGQCALADLRGHPQFRRQQQPQQHAPAGLRTMQPADHAVQRRLQRARYRAGTVAMRQVVGGILPVDVPERLQLCRVVVADAHLRGGRTPGLRFRGVVGLEHARRRSRPWRAAARRTVRETGRSPAPGIGSHTPSGDSSAACPVEMTPLTSTAAM